MLPLAKSYLFSPGLFHALALITIFVILWVKIGIRQVSLSRSQSISSIVLCIFCWGDLLYVTTVIGPNEHITHSRNIEDPLVNITWSPIQNLNVNLLPLMLAMNVHLMNTHVPSDYAGNSQKLFSRKINYSDAPTEPVAELPDIVILLSESFFNLNHFSSLHFNVAPTPSFDREEARYGASVITPAFGGGTANVEFEILTGLRTALLPNGSIPYMQYIDKEVPTSLPNYLKTLGYETVAIHPFDGSFWKRDQVYPLIGIDRFIDKSNFENAPTRGPFVKDSALAQKILEELDSASKKPKFIFAASMENHGNYVDPNRYDTRLIHSLNAPTQEMQTVLDNYAEGMHDADQSFAALTNAVRHRSRPTLFVFFGDHLSIPLYMMEDAGLVSSDYFDLLTSKDRRTIHTVQAALISNLDSIRWPDRRFQMNNMAPEILRAAGIPMSPYWHLINAASSEFPVHIYGYLEDASGRVIPSSDVTQSSYMHTMRLLTYDLLFGDQHLVKHLNGDSQPIYAKTAAVASKD
ncbi:LTA synthase family protein [Undibacterium terreum]|nr:LTA synthase family protein [Undibacterium terreum]